MITPSSSPTSVSFKIRTSLWLLWALSIPLSIGAAFLSMMLFDAPGSEGNAALNRLFFIMVTGPLTLLMGAIAGKFYAKKIIEGVRPNLLLSVFTYLPLIQLGCVVLLTALNPY